MNLQVGPQDALLDVALNLTVSDLKPCAKVTIEASMLDAFSQPWHSKATFIANDKGVINVASQAPVAGSYKTVDPLGLLWSMRPPLASQLSTFVPDAKAPLDVEFVAYYQDGEISQQKLKRHFVGLDVHQKEVNTHDIKGYLFTPQQTEPMPAIMLCGGEGGVASQLPLASVLASYGYVVFILAYCRYKELPSQLYDIPLEHFRNGVAWLKHHVKVDPERIALIGEFKGAEGLLAAASYFELQARAIVAVSPSSVIWQGFGKGKPEMRSSWSKGGESLAFVAMSRQKIFLPVMFNKIIRKLKVGKYFPAYTRTSLCAAYANVKNAALIKGKMIPVQNIQSPLLLLAGSDDKLFPSAFMCEQIQQMRAVTPRAELDEVHVFKNAGHHFQLPSIPTTIPWMAVPKGMLTLNYGGQALAQAQANKQALETIMAFLQKHLA